MKEFIEKRTLVDVRSPQEFAAEYFSVPINIPLDEAAKRINEFKELPRPIIAYCRSGNRRRMAVAILKQHGLAEAINGGGIDYMVKSVIP